MDGEATAAVNAGASEDARLESLGYKPQLNRVLGFFSNFAVGFTYLSPMVGIYSLFVLGFGVAGPAYIWLTFIPLIGMLFVALVFGELASNYPVAGALFQYSKFSVGPRFGWFVGWFYGFALLITVALLATLAPDEFQSTMGLSVSFLRPVRPGRITGIGRVVHRDGELAFLEATLADSDGTVIATATATARVIALDQARSAA